VFLLTEKLIIVDVVFRLGVNKPLYHCLSKTENEEINIMFFHQHNAPLDLEKASINIPREILPLFAAGNVFVCCVIDYLK